MFQRVLRKGNLPAISGNVNWCSHYGKQYEGSKKKKKWFPYDPTIPLLGIYPDKTIIQKDTCTPRFIEALFIIAEMWKQPKYPSTNKWMKKTWHTCARIHTRTHTHACTHILSLPRSCWNLSWLHPFPGPAPPLPSPDNSQDLNLIKFSHSQPSSCPDTYILKMCQWISPFENTDQVSPRALCARALETSLCPPPSPQWSPHWPQVCPCFPPSGTWQMLCPRLKGSFLPAPPSPSWEGTAIPLLGCHILREVFPSPSQDALPAQGPDSVTSSK